MNKFITLFIKEDGFTIVEILAAIAIAGILLTVIGSLYIFAFNGHNEVQELAMRQQDIILVKNYFNRELSNATEINLLPSLPSPIDSSFNYIYLDNNSIIHKDNSGNKTITSNMEALNFKIIENSTSGLYNYHLEYIVNNLDISSIILNNLSEYSSSQNESIIQYKKP